MKRLSLLLAMLLLVGCAPSPESIQTAIAQTQTVWTPIPTQTPYPTYTPFPSPTWTPSATPTPDSAAILNGVVAAFTTAGLEADSPFLMGPDDYGTAPQLCNGMRFLIPSLGPENGGRVFVCNDPAEMSALGNFYISLGKRGGGFYSWIFSKGNILVQINGALPEAKAKLYEAAIP